MDDLLRSLLDALDHASDGVIGGQVSAVEWHNAVARELFAHHLAAYAGAAQKEVGDVIGQVKPIVARQVDYLNKFTDAIESGRYQDTPDALRARAALYAGSLKESEIRGQWGDWEIPDGLMPTYQECGGACRCSIAIADKGDGTGTLTRTLGGDAHCQECPPLAGDHPVRRSNA